jgi:hypothetical protein
VTEDEWLAARAGLSQRKGKRGRVSERINLFAGLLRNAADGARYYATTRQSGTGKSQDRTKAALLITSAAANGRGAARSFPLATFENAILSCLREIDPRDILPGDGGPDETAVLAGQLAGVEAELSGAAAFMETNGFSPTIGKRVQALEARRAELAAQLADAKARLACPAAGAWGEAKTLIQALDRAPDPEDARLRLRAALRRIVDEIWLLVTNRGNDRLCAVQVWFAEGEKFRNYLILHRPPKGNGKARQTGRWWCRSIRYYTMPGQMDFRKRADAEYYLRHYLTAFDPEHDEVLDGGKDPFTISGTVMGNTVTTDPHRTLEPLPPDHYRRTPRGKEADNR